MTKIIRNVEYRNVVKLLFIWQKEKKEQWLGEMSQKGWHLEDSGFLYFRFKKGEPKNLVYRYDFNLSKGREAEDYIAIFEDAGWEYVSRFGNWYYFKIEPRDGLVPEIYTDNASKLKMYRSILMILGVIALPQLLFLVMILTGSIDIPPLSLMITLLYALILGLLTYGILRVLLIIKRIKQDIREQLNYGILNIFLQYPSS